MREIREAEIKVLKYQLPQCTVYITLCTSFFADVITFESQCTSFQHFCFPAFLCNHLSSGLTSHSIHNSQLYCMLAYTSLLSRQGTECTVPSICLCTVYTASCLAITNVLLSSLDIVFGSCFLHSFYLYFTIGWVQYFAFQLDLLPFFMDILDSVQHLVSYVQVCLGMAVSTYRPVSPPCLSSQ